MPTFNTDAFIIAYFAIIAVVIVLKFLHCRDLIIALRYTAKVITAILIIVLILCAVMGIMAVTACFVQGYNLFDLLKKTFCVNPSKNIESYLVMCYNTLKQGMSNYR